MCFKITLAQREYFHSQGVSAEVERRGYGSSRPELAWANRQDLTKPEKSEDEVLGGRRSPPKAHSALEHPFYASIHLDFVD